MTRNVLFLKLLLGIGVCVALGTGVREAFAAPAARGFCTDPLASGYCSTGAQCQGVCQAAGFPSGYPALCNFSTHCCYCERDP
ncbi:hypothetical protein [Longimicrobium sp.]|uniref:hypothetical protein n=1 Tax=Longimicrobium sp. TaxID=2029185 RepID=UPI002B91AA4D|nr:hypothetical protein [Longimicrobium sp.]HSU17907.1 hypothetical protein [Longimicrobium sp.]